MDVTDDVTTTDDALSCNGFHHDPAKHIGHHHHRHHHGHDQGGTGGGGAGGSRPHLTGTGGSGGSAMGGSGGSSTGGTGGVAVDPRCAMVPGIVSWWHGDGDFDDAVGSNDGTNGGAVTFGAGVENQGFDLNGASGSFVEVPDAANLEMTTALTIDAWIEAPALGGRIVDKITAFASDGYLLDVLGGQLRMLVGQDAIMSGVSIPAGMFAHVAGVFDGSTLALYINGALVAQTNTSGAPIPVNAGRSLRVGADSQGGSTFMGMIDEPRVFNRALGASEIQSLFWQSTNCP